MRVATRTRPKHSPARIVAICLLAAGLACNFPGQAVTPPTSGSNRSAIIQEVVGPVSVRQTADGVDSPAQVDQVVPPGAQIGTQPGGRAKVGLPEAGAFVRMDEGTNLAVLELTTDSAGPVSRFGLLQGKVWAVLPPTGGGQAVVETPGGMATGLGQMSVEYHSNFAGTGAPLFLVTCLQGVCSVSNPFGGVALTPGQQTEVAGTDSGPSAPHPMDPAQQSDWVDSVPELGGVTPTPADTLTPTPSDTPLPGETPATATFTFTPSQTPTPTPLGPPCIVVAADANIRSGPNTVYDVYGVMVIGEMAEVVGQDSTRTWYAIVYSKSPTGRGWIWSQLVTPCGDHSNVPIIPAPPTPTYTPTATFTISPTFTPSYTPSRTPTTTGTVYPPPAISADPNPVTAGCDLTNVVITWTAPGAVSATLNGERATVPTGKASACVLQDTVFTLIANYANGVQRQTQVLVEVDIEDS